MGPIKKINEFLSSYKIGFVRGHSYINNQQIFQIKQVLDYGDGEEIIRNYEQLLAQLIGGGFGISFAAGRMAFYLLLKVLNIGEGDEVILLGFTCSVMVNAVWRSGATPVFSDIDSETFGSHAEEIKKRITLRTKLIVAQHSFGIPCNIPEIVELGRKHGIFVIEDCAITLDSSINGIKVGNWADAAIFSTDHSKPLNTLIGGFIYTPDTSLYGKIKEFSQDLPHLDTAHQERLYEQFLLERNNYAPTKYPWAKFVSYMREVKKKLNRRNSVIFLEADYKRQPASSSGYPYPAKMPPFLAQLGLFELEHWVNEKRRRKNLLKEYINIMEQSDFSQCLPKAYRNHNLDIVPLRFVFQHPDSRELIKKMSSFIDVTGIWFRQPIVCAPDGPQSLGYKFGSCPVSERVGLNIINWPCVFPQDWETKILEAFKKNIKE